MVKANNKLVVELPPAVTDELAAIVQKLGIPSIEALVTNYLREVIIAARIDAATASLRETVARGSSDLDSLRTDSPQKNV